MKKVFTILLAVIIAASLLAGCQATPEQEIVIQKDLEQMIEKAGATDAAQTQGISLRERTGAPETFVMNGSSGTLTLTVNAPVVLPDAGRMPILNVRSTIFSQETVDKYWDVLMGNTPMWEWSDQPTKEQIEQMIVNQRQMQAQAEQEGSDTEGYEDIIVELERLHQTAPETAEATPATSQLKEKINWDPVLGTIDTRYMGTSGHSAKSQAEAMNTDDWIYFSASNPWTGEEGSIKSDTSPAMIRFEASAINNNYRNSTDIDEDTVLDASILALLKMTPKEAKQKVEEFLSRTGTPMMVYSMRLMSDADEAAGKRAQHYAYGVTCVRVLESGLTVAAPPTAGASNIMPPGYLPMSPAPTFSSFWTYEHLEIEMDNNGFFQIDWHYHFAFRCHGRRTPRGLSGDAGREHGCPKDLEQMITLNI